MVQVCSGAIPRSAIDRGAPFDRGTPGPGAVANAHDTAWVTVSGEHGLPPVGNDRPRELVKPTSIVRRQIDASVAPAPAKIIVPERRV